MEQIAPDLFRAYSSAQSRFHDLVVSFVFSTTTIGTLWWIVLSAYQREQQRLHETVAELERRVAEVHTLRGLLPICAWCKRIRTDRGLWTEVERYLAGQPNVELTHALCPDCRTKNFPDLPPGEE